MKSKLRLLGLVAVFFGLFTISGISNPNTWYENVPNEVSIYPNPTSNMLSIRYKAENDYQIIISNILGTVVYKSKTINSFEDHHMLYLRDLNINSGLYLVKIFEGDKLKAAKKLVVKSN